MNSYPSPSKSTGTAGSGAAAEVLSQYRLALTPAVSVIVIIAFFHVANSPAMFLVGKKPSLFHTSFL